MVLGGAPSPLLLPAHDALHNAKGSGFGLDEASLNVIESSAKRRTQEVCPAIGPAGQDSQLFPFANAVYGHSSEKETTPSKRSHGGTSDLMLGLRNRTSATTAFLLGATDSDDTSTESQSLFQPLPLDEDDTESVASWEDWGASTVELSMVSNDLIQAGELAGAVSFERARQTESVASTREGPEPKQQVRVQLERLNTATERNIFLSGLPQHVNRGRSRRIRRPLDTPPRNLPLRKCAEQILRPCRTDSRFWRTVIRDQGPPRGGDTAAHPASPRSSNE